ncbi:hypothetical protein BJ165DRAFT_1112625 [Panaeolus papilionaceus]|nr:hypothetical protein BJ165DRAFT_1112625 [Panaeolus papilionaceus]
MPSNRPTTSADGRPETGISEYEYEYGVYPDPVPSQRTQANPQYGSHQHQQQQYEEEYEEDDDESDDGDVFAFVPPTTAEQQMEREREEADRVRMRMEEERRGGNHNPFAFAAGSSTAAQNHNPYAGAQGYPYQQQYPQHQQYPNAGANDPYANYGNYPATAETTSSASSAPFAFSFNPDSRPDTSDPSNHNTQTFGFSGLNVDDDEDDMRPTTSAGLGGRPVTSAGRPTTRAGGFASFGVALGGEGSAEMREVQEEGVTSPTSATPFVTSHNMVSRNPYFAHTHPHVPLAPPSPSTDSAPSTGMGEGGLKMRKLGGSVLGRGASAGAGMGVEDTREEETDDGEESAGAGPVPEHGPAAAVALSSDANPNVSTTASSVSGAEQPPSRASVIRDRVQSELDWESRRSREVRVSLPVVNLNALPGDTTEGESGIDLNDDRPMRSVTPGTGAAAGERAGERGASGRATPVGEGEHPLSPLPQAYLGEGEDKGRRRKKKRHHSSRGLDAPQGVTASSSRGATGTDPVNVNVGIGGGGYPIGPGGMKPHANHAGVVLATGVSASSRAGLKATAAGAGGKGGAGAKVNPNFNANPYTGYYTAARGYFERYGAEVPGWLGQSKQHPETSETPPDATHKSQPSGSTTLPTSAGTTLGVEEWEASSASGPERGEYSRDRHRNRDVDRERERDRETDLEIGSSKKRRELASSVDDDSYIGTEERKREKEREREREWYTNDPSNTSHSRRDTSFSQSGHDDESGEWDEEEEWVRGAGGGMRGGVGGGRYGDDDEGSIKCVWVSRFSFSLSVSLFFFWTVDWGCGWATWAFLKIETIFRQFSLSPLTLFCILFFPLFDLIFFFFCCGGHYPD